MCLTDKKLGNNELYVLWEKKLIEESKRENFTLVTLSELGKLWKPIFLEEREVTHKLNETLEILTSKSNETEFHHSGLIDILEDVPESLASLYRISVTDSIIYSWDRRLRVNNMLKNHPEIFSLAVGSCARFEAQYYSDLEYVLISNDHTFRSLMKFADNVDKYLIDRFKMKKNDYRVGTPENIVNFSFEVDSKSENREKDIENKLMWALTPIFDGYPLTSLSFPFDINTQKWKKRFQDSLLSVRKIKEEELYNWGARRFLTSAREKEKVIKTTTKVNERVKAIHHATTFSIRALTLLYMSEKSQEPQNLPYWLAPRFLRDQLPASIEIENISEIVLTTMAQRRKATDEEKKVLLKVNELLAYLRLILEEVEKNLEEKFLRRE